MNTFFDIFRKLLIFSIVMGTLNFILGFLKPYFQAIIYHMLVGFRVLFSSFLHSETIQIVGYTIGIILLIELFRIFRKFI